jgi:hypothetical protein
VVYDIAFLTFNVYKHSIQYTIVIGYTTFQQVHRF